MEDERNSAGTFQTGAIIVLVILIGLVLIRLPDAADEVLEERRIEAKIAVMMKDANENLPLMVNESIRWDSASATIDQITYYWTILDETWTMSADDIRSKLRNSMCTNEDPRFFLDNGIELRYRISRYDYHLIADITIKPSECD